MINIRKATKSDALFVARMILIALHIEEQDYPWLYKHMVELVEDEHTLYHWSRNMIATTTVDGNDEISVGLCLAYDGSDYHERRVYSFDFVCKDGRSVSENNDVLLEQPDESKAGEYYIDSLAVIPEYRGMGIGRMLLKAAMSEANKKSLTSTILVDPNNTPAVSLYESVGFIYQEEMFVFGQMYNKMRC